MFDDDAAIFDGLDGFDEKIVVLVDGGQPSPGALEHHALARDHEAAPEDVVGEDEGGIAMPAGELAGDLGAAFEDIIGVAPEDVIASGEIEGLLAGGGEVIDVGPGGGGG